MKILNILHSIDKLLYTLTNQEHTQEQEDKILNNYEILFEEAKKESRENPQHKNIIPQRLNYLSHYFFSDEVEKEEARQWENTKERLKFYNLKH